MTAPTRTPGEFAHSVSWRRAQLAAVEASGLTVSQCIIWSSGESFLARQQAMERAVSTVGKSGRSGLDAF